MKPDRVVIGAEDPRAAEMMKELYAPFTRTGAPIMMMDCASAELCKYAANAMLATRISFMNEVANVCEAVGADVDQVRRAVASDRRIGPSFLFPGVGYGGSCFPEGRQGDDAASPRTRTTTSRSCTPSKRQRAPEGPAGREDEAALRLAEGQAHRASGAWRSSRRPTTCARRRPCRSFTGCWRPGATVHAYDPEAMKVARSIFGSKIHYADKSYDALTGADALAIVTEWNEFREPDYVRMREADAEPGHLRRPQHLQPGAAARARLHLPLDGPPVSVLVTGGAGYIGSHAVEGAARARRPTSSSTTTSARGTGRRPRHAARVVEGRHPATPRGSSR